MSVLRVHRVRRPKDKLATADAQLYLFRPTAPKAPGMLVAWSDKLGAQLHIPAVGCAIHTERVKAVMT